MKAFSKPIYHDWLKILSNLRHNLSSELYNSRSNENSSVLTVNLYLKLASTLFAGQLTKQISNSNMASIESDYDFNEIDISWFEQNCIPAELLFGTDYESILLEIENHAKFKRRKRRRNSDFTSKNSILDEEQKATILEFNQSRLRYHKAIFD